MAFSKLATIFVLTMWGGTCLERKPLQRKVEPRNGDKFWTLFEYLDAAMPAAGDW